MTNRERQIVHQAAFKALCSLYQGTTLGSTDAFEEATLYVKKLEEQYQEEGSEMLPPTKPLTSDQYQGTNTATMCPVCGTGEIVRKKGTNKKTGKPYDFRACNRFPQCTYVEQ